MNVDMNISTLASIAKNHFSPSFTSRKKGTVALLLWHQPVKGSGRPRKIKGHGLMALEQKRGGSQSRVKTRTKARPRNGIDDAQNLECSFAISGERHYR
jgi:hypothetical protein